RPPGAPSDRGRVLLVGAALLLGVGVVFAPLRNASFISLDDTAYVTGNPHVRAGLTGPGAAWAFCATGQGNWHPLTWLSHMLDVTLWGLDPRGHHATSVLLHGANSLLVFDLLRRLFALGARRGWGRSDGEVPADRSGTIWAAGLAAALFAVHPLHVES